MLSVRPPAVPGPGVFLQPNGWGLVNSFVDVVQDDDLLSQRLADKLFGLLRVGAGKSDGIPWLMQDAT